MTANDFADYRLAVGGLVKKPLNLTVDELIALGRPLFCADAHAPIAAAWPPQSRSVLVLGSEGGGVSEAIRAVATPVAIPMTSRVESLNVAASAAILLSKAYEARRGR